MCGSINVLEKVEEEATFTRLRSIKEPVPEDLSSEDYITDVYLLFPGGEQVFHLVMDIHRSVKQ